MLRSTNIAFKNRFKSLKEISRSKHEQGSITYLTQSTRQAVDFDSYTRSTYKRKPYTPASNDALLFSTDHNYFIEFKSGNPDNVTLEDICKKNEDSIKTLIENNLEEKANFPSKYIYILVYNPKHDPEQYLGSLLYEPTGKPYFVFGLDDLIGEMFENIHTVPVDFFETTLLPQIPEA